MTHQYVNLPDGTFASTQWTLVGGTEVHSILGDEDDASYLVAPSTRDRCSITFPINLSALPKGASIKSITIMVRAKRLTTKPRPLTLQVTSRDWTARFNSRTVYPSETIENIQVATYTRDPRNRSWDIYALNNCVLRMLSSDRVNDCIRVYKYWMILDYTEPPTTTVTSPAGTVVTPTPTIEWTYTHDEGEAHLKTDYKIFTQATYNTSGFNPSWSTPVVDETVEQDVFSEVLPTSLDPDTYYVFVRVWSILGTASQWIGRQFSVDSPAPAPPGDDNQSLTGTPGLGTLKAVASASESSFALTGRDATNRMSVQQADFEHPDDPLEYVGSNCTLARTTDEYYPGGGESSMKLTASSAADMRADATMIEVGSSDIEAGGTIPYTVRCQFKADSDSRTCRIDTLFYDQDFSLVQTDTGTGVANSTSTWTELSETGTTHSDAHYAEVRLVVLSPASSEVHYVDHVGFMYGTGSQWTNGGFASRNVLTSSLATGDDPVGDITWVGANVRSATSRVATSGTGSHGTKTNRMTYSAVSPSIALRAYGSQFSSPTSGTSFTLNKPSGIADNDLYIATVAVEEVCDMSTVPSGWTLVSTIKGTGFAGGTLFILTKDALAADPSTWTDGEVSVDCDRRSALVGAYSGCEAAANQFIAEAGRNQDSGDPVHTTPTVSNTDSNAWRMSAFVVTDHIGGNTSTANIVPPSSQSVEISFVGSASTWKTSSSSDTFKINRPSGVAEDDLMIACLSWSGSSTSVTPPSGWTLSVVETQVDNTSGATTSAGRHNLAILKKVAGSSEPTSWSGSVSGTTYVKTSSCVAYRNAKSAFIDTATSSEEGNSDDVTTGTVSNDNSGAWRLTFGAQTDGFASFEQNSTEVINRVNDSTNYGGFVDHGLVMMDSNDPVSTGDHQREVDWDVVGWTRCSWIGLIEPLDSVTPPADETERLDDETGASDPFLYHAVYDSNGTVPATDMSVTQEMTLSSGELVHESLSWIGLIKPAGAVENDEVAAETSESIDLSLVDSAVLTLADNKMTMVASMMGSASGTPLLELDFLRATELITTRTAGGSQFDTSAWTKASATFDIPDGATHVKPRIKVQQRVDTGTVDFDRVGVLFGDNDTWHNGTDRATHSIWSLPEIQYQDDDGTGFSDWAYVFGQKTLYAPFYSQPSGVMSYTDHTAIPASTRRYRSRTFSYGLNGDFYVSAWSPDSDEVSFTADTWWLKDLSNLDNNMSLDVKAEPLGVETTNTSTVFQPLGEDFPLVVSQGYKADSFEITAFCDHDEFVALKQLIKTRTTMYLQSNMDRAWWVRVVDALQSKLLVTYKFKSDPLREVTLKFVQVKPEE